MKFKKKKHKKVILLRLLNLVIWEVYLIICFFRNFGSNRDILNVGKSLLITVVKDISNQANRFKRISVRKLVSLGEISKYSIPKITFEIEEVDNLKKLKDLISERGDTNVKIVVQYNSKNLIFELSEKRKINPEILKSLKNEPYLKRIRYNKSCNYLIKL
jgi:DNA polymerase-3 subunit alpha